MSARICIGGGPRTGKTTLASSLGGEPGVVLRATDDLIATHDWSAASLAASKWFDDAGPWVAEGVAIVRAIRKWLQAHPEGKPCDVLVWLDTPHVPLKPGQSAMARGCQSILAEILPELRRRGVEIRGASGTR